MIAGDDDLREALKALAADLRAGGEERWARVFEKAAAESGRDAMMAEARRRLRQLRVKERSAALGVRTAIEEALAYIESVWDA